MLDEGPKSLQSPTVNKIVTYEWAIQIKLTSFTPEPLRGGVDISPTRTASSEMMLMGRGLPHMSLYSG